MNNRFVNNIPAIVAETRALPANQQLPFIKEKLNEYAEGDHRELAELTILQQLKNPPAKEIVVCIHGINTRGTWQEDFKALFANDPSVEVMILKYGWFNPLYFWFPFFTRGIPVNKTVEQLLHIQNNHRNDNLSIVSHSFGTYIVGKILKNHSYISINKLILSGSVLKENFDWNNIVTKPVKIVNEVGVEDYLPLAAQSLSWGYGSAGLYGFGHALVEDRFHKKGHSDFFIGDFMRDFWVPIIKNGNPVSSTYKRMPPNVLLNFLPFLVKLGYAFVLIYIINKYALITKIKSFLVYLLTM